MNSIFENLPVDADQLPKVENIEFKPIERKYLKVSLWVSSIFWSILFIGVGISLFFAEVDNPVLLYVLALGPILLLALSNTILTIKGFRKKKYALRQRDIIYTKGLLWSVRTAIPFNRIQHAELKQGPVERIFGLHSLKIFTAGGQTSDLVIPGLREEVAQSIKDFILGKTAEDGREEPS